MSANLTRSQVILRMPVDNLVASLILHDGERADVMLFLHGGEDIARLIESPAYFVPVVHNGRVSMIARTAIACLELPAKPPVATEDDALPVHRQRVIVRLRSGATVDGELRWCDGDGVRTTDHLNADPAYFELHRSDAIAYVMKAHVASVSEVRTGIAR